MPISFSPSGRRLALVILPALVLFASGCKDKKAAYVPPPPPEVTVQKPVQRTVTEFAEYTGHTEAVATVELRARVEGFLERVEFTPSAKVKKGQLLFIIDPRPYQARVNQAKAKVATSEAELKAARATLLRKERAYKDRAVSEVEVIQARADMAKAAAGVQAAKADLESAMIDLGYTHIHSPIDGRISRTLVDVGNLVGAGEATLLSTVVQEDPIFVYFYVSERDLLFYLNQPGHKREGGEPPEVLMGLANEKGYPHRGKVDYVDNQVDPNTGTIQVRAVFPNPEEKIFPGLFARLRLPYAEIKDALLVPETALGFDQGGRYLLVVGDDGKVQFRRVELGPLQDDGLRVIRKGLKAGEWVIVNGVQRVRPGIKVKPVEAGQGRKGQGAAPKAGERGGKKDQDQAASPDSAKQGG